VFGRAVRVQPAPSRVSFGDSIVQRYPGCAKSWVSFGHMKQQY
jgi:hypothetical protein